MSADSFHGLVEKSFKKYEYKNKYGELQNFEDYEKCIKSARKNTDTI